MYPEISAYLSVSLQNLMQKQEHETDDFLILKKRKRTKKEKREKNKLTNNYLILKLKKNIIYYIYFSLFADKRLKTNTIYGRIGSYRFV